MVSALLAVMIKWQDSLAWSYPWVTCENCITTLDGNELNELTWALDTRNMYEIYKAGVANCKNYQIDLYVKNYIEKEISRCCKKEVITERRKIEGKSLKIMVCSSCKKDLTLKDRIFKCPTCGMQKDRDLNASINLRNKSVSYTASNACGVSKNTESSLLRDTVKQEENDSLNSNM